ncbi:protein strawberry notch 1 [Carex littledalei]|uniref:Protein strawberry notch 1 n=1 Tax=Carex littledalei TaxID=544730 RepID=A0A833V5I3_9POAL|nr:protein strawberry notch 1 [Carex littledalei]
MADSPPVPPPPGCLHVRCAECFAILMVGPGMTQFICPKCQLAQRLPPEMIPFLGPVDPGPGGRRPQPRAQGIDPTKLQLPCASCKAILNVPYGLTRFKCPQCDSDLSIDPGVQLPPPNPFAVPPLARIRSVGIPILPAPEVPPEPEEINEVAIDVEREEDEGGPIGETFTDYRPPRINLGAPHPDPIVETSCLSAVQPPEPTYDISIIDEVERTNALSCLQIETIIYASQRHLQHLPNSHRAGFFIGDGAGVGKGRTVAGLIWENWQHGRHRAIWVSVGSDLKYDARRDLDDVGANCVEVHPLNKVSYSKLDSKAIGIKSGVVFVTYSSLIASSERGRSRLQQLVQWCGPQFDGLVVFDECHKAKNLIPESGSQPTRTGSAVLELQEKLPEARVVYCSATGASEPRNMAYMVRLGLWGAGSSFEKFQGFHAALEKGGVGALELVAMELKARGMYLCRTLSYKGAEFEVVEAVLDERMMEMYKKAAEFWTELRFELLSASTYFVDEKNNGSQLWRIYWASHQRFFRHICMSAKVPTVVSLAKEALAQDKCVVVGLQSTGEARTEEAVSKYGSELDDFVSGPRELLLKFVEDHYPLPSRPDPKADEELEKENERKRPAASHDVSIRGRVRKVAKWKESSDEENGDDEYAPSDESDHESTESDDEFQICQICNNVEEEKTLLLHCSCCGKLVHPNCLIPPWTGPINDDWSCHSCHDKTDEFFKARDQYVAELSKRFEDASERKKKILDLIKSLDLPNNPLDDLIDLLGGPQNVAEITGRRGMLVRAPGGRGVVYQPRNTKEVTMEFINMHEKKLFMDGKKLIAIISEAGSAGVSLHADRRAPNQRRRVHITLELPWSADRAIQQFGRTHRSNQTSAPQYRYVVFVYLLVSRFSRFCNYAFLIICRLLFTNLGGEKRFASIVAKRLESLGALTQGDRRAGPSMSAFNYDSTYGRKALVAMYRGIMEQDPLLVVPPGCSSDDPSSITDFITKARAALVSVGIIREIGSSNGNGGKMPGRIVDSDMHDVARFLNRLLGLPPNIQNKLFELFTTTLDVILHRARIEGQLDSGIVDITANKIELQGPPKTVYEDNLSGASTVLFTFIVDRGITWEAAQEILETKKNSQTGSSNDGFYESKREWMGKRHVMLAYEGPTPGFFKIIRPAVGEAVREMPLAELKSKYRKASSIEKVSKGWQEEYDTSSKQCMHGPKCKVGSFCTVGKRLQEVNILGGLILPLWRIIEKALNNQARQSHKRLRIVRLETTDENQRVVGLLIPNAAVDHVLQGLSWDHSVELEDED